MCMICHQLQRVLIRSDVMSICFVHMRNEGSQVSIFEPTLSQYMRKGVFCSKLRRLRRLHIHMASFALWQLAMYSASVLDVTKVSCFFELHEMSPEPRLNVYPETDQHVSVHAPQSKSTQPVRVISRPPRTSVRFLVAYRYRIVCCAAVQ